MIVDTIGNWASYPFGDAWKCAFEFLLSIKDDKDIEERKYSIIGDDIFAIVMNYETKQHREAVLEAHRRYIDIQTAIIAAEGIEWFPTKGLDVKTPYDAEKDVTFFSYPQSAPARVDVHPGTFAALFPQDAHMPQLIVNNTLGIVKKVVVKIKVSLIKTPVSSH